MQHPFIAHVKLIFVRLKVVSVTDYHVTWKSVQSMRRSFSGIYKTFFKIILNPRVIKILVATSSMSY